jgi:O-antigen/teichoic acid export membrane protein
MRKKKFLKSIGFLAIVTGGSAVVMLLWNWLIPTIFGLETIHFWQVLIIITLCCFIVCEILRRDFAILKVENSVNKI